MKYGWSMAPKGRKEMLKGLGDIGILMASALVIFILWFHFTFVGLTYPDAMDYAQIGRHLLRGEGFVTSYITPLSLGVKPSIPHPNLWRPPLHPLILSLSFHLFGVRDSVVAMSSGVFFILSVGAVYLLGRALFSRSIALVSGALFLLTPKIIHYSMSGLTESLFIFLIVVFALLMYKKNTNPLLLGAILGLCYLTRYNALMFGLPALLFLYFTTDRPRMQALFLFCCGFLAVISPWLVRNWIVMGNPFFTLQSYEVAAFTQTYPGYDLYHTIHPVAPLRFVLDHKLDVFRKAVAGLATFKGALPRLTNFGIMAFFFVSIFHSHESPRMNRFRYVVYAAALLQVMALLLVHHLTRLFLPFIPFVIIFAIYYLDWALGRLFGKKVGLKRAIFYAVIVFLFVSFHSLIPKEVDRSRANSGVGRLVRENTDPDAVVVSNNAWAVSWYGERASILNPISGEMIREIHSSIVPVDWIMLQIDGTGTTEPSDVGKGLWAGMEGLGEFKPVRELHGDGIRAVLFRRGD